MKGKEFFSVLCMLAWICGGTLPAAGAELRILHINDLHGWILPHRPAAGRPEEGGAARLASLVRKNRTEATIFVAAGDLMGGGISRADSGGPVIEALNAMGLAASAAGNHDFDYGLDIFRERAAEATFPFLAANVAGEGADFLEPYRVVTVGSLRVGLFGLTTVETPFATAPRNVAGLTFLPPVPVAAEMITLLEPLSDVIVCLSHLGFEEDEALAKSVDGIDVIVGGHTHTRVPSPVRVGGTVIVQAYERGAVLGLVDVSVEDGRVTGHDGRLIPVDAAAGP